MDNMSTTDGDLTVDLESGGTAPRRVCDAFARMNGLNKGENGVVNLSGNLSGVNEVEVALDKVELCSMDDKVEGHKAVDLVDNNNKSGKERPKRTSAKKPPRPPRPPKALSLDAADQKLIKELSELSMIKRSRIERTKALKKMKAAKASTSTGSLFAMICTFLFCLVMVFQGMFPQKNSPISFQDSQVLALVADSSSISSHHDRTKSATSNDARISGFHSPSLEEQLSGRFG
ncbi:uncharacterized protein LOC127796425 [Diospyros lotus]|uniref:uncharacterized protein LOC127796425 n=1 Tax=Diospyros lotus TaxID=55363 RepID=UPI0022507014|nr:uncharacterized protein LOC127796425 [Diospyros lotus]XP_052184523.1 uncharacterized protein LOC127796425 [Diospyros lotus]XP_052184524.1 uncharacterized protein LOC127796425 [Diospyros lotus]XP_052184525.1 uncharacterized protein LOC127796425 [Diospyros lotus]